MVGRFLAGLLSGCLVASMNNYLVGWCVGVLRVRACVWFGFTMWQATEMLVQTMAVMRGFLNDAQVFHDDQAARHDVQAAQGGKGKDANYTVG